MRIHVSSFANIQVFNETDWDVLISASGKMQGFATCGCANSLACSTEVWTTVTNTAQLSPAQLNTLRATIDDFVVDILGFPLTNAPLTPHQPRPSACRSF